MGKHKSLEKMSNMDNQIQKKVYDLLNSLDIKFKKVEHRALFSQSDNEHNPINIDAQILKNLFLRNKAKSRYYLFVLPLEKKADLSLLRELLNETRLSFGNEDELEEMLHIKSGSVSLLNIIDAEATNVVFVIDKEIFNYPEIALHPNDNTASVIFSPNDIEKILIHYDAKYKFL